MKKSSIILAVAAALLGTVPVAQAHQYYNLTGAGAVGTDATTTNGIGLGLTNSINGTDGVSANSNGTARTTDGTTTYNAVSNNFIPGTGAPASASTALVGNLPYNWYAGHHTTAAGYTKREQWTGTSATANVGPLTNANGGLPTLPNGQVLPGTAANWGTAVPAVPNATLSPGSLWAAYTSRNTPFVAGPPATGSTYATALVDPSAAVDANGTVLDRPYLAVSGNSATTGLGLDYGLIHVSCGANSALNNCATTTPVDALGNPTGPSVNTGDVLVTISAKIDSQYASLNDPNANLSIALYRGADSSLTSSRTAAYTTGDTNPQGSNLGSAIWTASTSSASDILFYSFIFNQAEWLATNTGANGAATNGFYTLIIGGLGGTATSALTYDVLTTTSPVPVPAAVWLFASALGGLGVFGCRKSTSA